MAHAGDEILKGYNPPADDSFPIEGMDGKTQIGMIHLQSIIEHLIEPLAESIRILERRVANAQDLSREIHEVRMDLRGTSQELDELKDRVRRLADR